MIVSVVKSLSGEVGSQLLHRFISNGRGPTAVITSAYDITGIDKIRRLSGLSIFDRYRCNLKRRPGHSHHEGVAMRFNVLHGLLRNQLLRDELIESRVGACTFPGMELHFRTGNPCEKSSSRSLVGNEG